METTSLAVTVKVGLLVVMATSSLAVMAITSPVVTVKAGLHVVMETSSLVAMETSSLAVMARAGPHVVMVTSSLVVTVTTAGPSVSTTMSVNGRLRRATVSTVAEQAVSEASPRLTATISGPCAPRTRTLRCLARLHPKTFTRRLATS